MKLKKYFIYSLATLASISFTACSDDDDDNNGGGNGSKVENPGLFVINNGTYGVPNGSLSFYDPATSTVANEVFSNANGIPLGEVAQSMSIYGNLGYVVVNMANTIYGIDIDDYDIKYVIKDHLTSPRYFVQVEQGKFYASQMNTDKISVFKKQDNGFVYDKEITVDNTSNGGNEQVVVAGKYAYTNAWSYGKTLSKIDIATDKVVAQLEIGVQPKSIVYVESDNTLWVLCDGGGWEQNPVGYEKPTLVEVKLDSFTIGRKVILEMGSVGNLCYYSGKLYWLQNGVTTLDISKTVVSNLIASTSWSLYALTVDPRNGDIYVGDAIDYVQSGSVARYTNNGTPVSTFSVGVCPADFAWKL